MNDLSESVARLSRDLRTAAVTLSEQEARFLVDSYYTIQENRIRNQHQMTAMSKNREPHLLLGWLYDQNFILENQIKSALDRYSMSTPVGEWLRGQFGIGPVIAAGLMAMLDITKAPTVGHFWSHAGLIPGQKKEKGKKLQWNMGLKSLCWKAGESFVKFSNNDECYYGKVYKERKELEMRRNEAGEFGEQAARILTEKNFNKSTEAYKAYVEGKLPPAHVHARARRYAVKLFLSHLHDFMYRDFYKAEPPLPYPIAHLEHVHFIHRPN